MSKIKIGITIGDINGVGPEVIIKALSDERMLSLFTPIVYGSSKAMAYHKNIVENDDFKFKSISDASSCQYNKVNVLNCWEEMVDINIGTATEDGGKYAHIAMDKAVRDFKDHKIDAIVTAPINKHAMSLASFKHPGHTEFFAEHFSSSNDLMFMVSDDLKVALVTNHEPLSGVAGKITKELVEKKLQTLEKTMIQDFGIEKPSVAVLGLNPHAGDEGTIGSEDDEIIRPIIINAKKSGRLVMGPFAADGFFGSSQFRKFDAILAMYHDQGLIPFKALTFGTGTNFTAGLPLVRTSPDHGTAYDIAGNNKADASSFRNAIFYALDIAKNRAAYKEARENALSRK